MRILRLSSNKRRLSDESSSCPSESANCCKSRQSISERQPRIRVGAAVHDRSGTRFAGAKRRPSILRENRRRMMRKLLLTTVAAAAVVGVAGLASAQTMQAPSGGNAAKPESTEHQAPGAMGGALKGNINGPGAAKSAQAPAQGAKPDQRMGQDEQKQTTPQARRAGREAWSAGATRRPGSRNRGAQEQRGAQEEKPGTQEQRGAQEEKASLARRPMSRMPARPPAHAAPQYNCHKRSAPRSRPSSATALRRA